MRSQSQSDSRKKAQPTQHICLGDFPHTCHEMPNKPIRVRVSLPKHGTINDGRTKFIRKPNLSDNGKHYKKIQCTPSIPKTVKYPLVWPHFRS